MADLTLSDGKEITFDLYKFTFAEYSKIFEDDAHADELISKSIGMEAEALRALPFPDNRRIFAAFFKKCRDVMTDPNLESAST